MTKITLKVGDKVQVLVGKNTGKEGKVLFIDPKNKRVRLEGLKQFTSKTKKGESKKLHGTYHISSLKSLAAPAPAEGAAEAAPAPQA